KGYRFDPEEYRQYKDLIQESRDREAGRKRNKAAFEDESWRGILQARHLIIGFTAHGHHHLLCKDRSFHQEPRRSCACRHCGKRNINLEHLSTCLALDGELGGKFLEALRPERNLLFS